MSEIDKFAENFNRRLDGAKQAQLRFAICRSVNWNEKTMTATGVSDDVDYMDVKLGFGYIDIKPKIDTICLIGILEGKEALSFLINAEDVELVELKSGNIIINGGDNKGFVKVEKMTEWMQKVYSDLQTLKTQLSTHPTAGNGVPFGLVFNPTTSRPEASNFENNKITH
jgi:hypothetical protein